MIEVIEPATERVMAEVPRADVEETDAAVAAAKAAFPAWRAVAPGDRAALLRELGRQYLRWRDARGDAWACGLAADYHDRCATIGQHVLVSTADGGSFSGVATGIDAEGRLRISADGAEHVVAAGDIEHIGAATG